MPDLIPDTPRVQPEAPKHHSSPLPWVIVSIVLFLIIAAGAIAGFFLWPEDSVCEECESAQEVTATADEGSACIEMPFFYDALYHGQGYYLYMVDRCTGEKTELAYARDVANRLTAAPQIGYDGYIFVSPMGETANIGASIYKMYVATKEMEEVSFADMIPANGDAWVVSDDQTKLAVVYDNPNMGDDLRAAGVIDLITGERIIIGELDEGEYYSAYQGENTMSGAFGFTIEWLNETCFQAAVYEEPGDNFNAESEDHKQLDRYQLYCLETE